MKNKILLKLAIIYMTFITSSGLCAQDNTGSDPNNSAQKEEKSIRWDLQVTDPEFELTNYKLENKELCPIYSGVAFLDQCRQLEKLQSIKFYNVSYPLLMLPFISRASELLGKKIMIQYNNTSFLLNFDKSIFSKNIDTKKINLITGLIFLNMAPLHNVPFNFILLSLGIQIIHNNINSE